MTEDILERISKLSTPGFFVTADIIKKSDDRPRDIETFIAQKLSLISSGTSGRKFAFRDSGWQINFTFFPTNKVVDRRYALINKTIKLEKKRQ